MKRWSVYRMLALAGCMLAACNSKDIPFYDARDGALNFTMRSVEYSFINNETKEEAVIRVPLEVVGPAVDYPREVSVETLPEKSRNVTEADYAIAPCCIKAGELRGQLEITVRYDTLLQDTSKMLELRLAANEHFGIGLPAADTVSVLWTDQLVRPHQTTIWRSWWFWYGRTYSRNFHLLLRKVLGDEVEVISYYAIPADLAAEYPEYVRQRLPSYWYAANRKLREYVRKWDAEHPDEPLMHSDDAQYYSSYAVAVGQGQSRAGRTIASTLDRIY